jgi:hypothetical protein
MATASLQQTYAAAGAACTCLQDVKPFDQALQVAMAVIIHLELFVTIKAVSHGYGRGLIGPVARQSETWY